MRVSRCSTCAAVILGLVAGISISAETVGPENRRALLEGLQQRFAEEVYPLFTRQPGGCAVCHQSESPQSFRVLESTAATFSVLLEHGLLAPEDPLAIPSRVSAADPELRMPKGGTLPPDEQAVIRQFALDLADALSAPEGDARRADERFPDALLLPYDGPEAGDAVPRRVSYYQLRRSFETLFGRDWLAGSGPDPFQHKANLFGGADFRASFETSRTISASYLASLQEVAREVARRFVSAPRGVLFDGFDPDVSARRSRRDAVRNVKVLYQRILHAVPDPGEIERSLSLVRELQQQPATERVVRFALEVRDSEGRSDRQEVDALVRTGSENVSRFRLDQSRSVTASDNWVRIGSAPFRFEKGNADQFVRVIARPSNRVTAFDAVKLASVQNGAEDPAGIVLDNLDPECVLTGDWEPVEREGERSRAGPPKKKYELDLHVVGSNHLESRTLENRLSYATVALRIPATGEYNVYLSWPAIPQAAKGAIVEVRSSSGPASHFVPEGDTRDAQGYARIRIDQTESTLDEKGETQWELVASEVHFADRNDFVEINNQGVDSSKHVIAADAVKFSPIGGGREIVVDNSSASGFEKSKGWAPDRLVRNSPGRGKSFGDDLLHFPPSENGNPIKEQEIDPNARAWARYRPVRDGEYRPGWYSVYLWTPGGHTHSDWVAVDIHGSEFAPLAAVEAVPEVSTGETFTIDGSGTYHPLERELAYRWSHDAADLGLRIEGVRSAAPRVTVPSLDSSRPGWAGLIEALLQRPEFIVPSDDPDSSTDAALTRVALDLVGRIPTQRELRRFAETGSLESMVDSYLDSADFKDFFFHRARATLRSRGTEESDEPARLWTYLATNDRSYRELFTADYTVDAGWKRVSRRPEHGPTGILTMKGYLMGKPGLPKFTYPAQVLTFAMGLQFEVTDAVEQAREKVVSTTDPASMCYSCHKLLTPLAYQRERWDVHGHYRTVDEEHNPIDDSDRGAVPDYPFKGEGLGAFSTQVVRKERFVRTFINLHHDMLFHRQLRVYEDHRDEYEKLYEFALDNDLRIRPLLKELVMMRFQGG